LSSGRSVGLASKSQKTEVRGQNGNAYGYEHNPWTEEQAREAVRRQLGRMLFLRAPFELKVDTDTKMRDSRMEF